MSQTISNTIHENVSETKALRTALSMGACGGIAIGPAVIVSIVANIYFVCSIVKGPNGLDDFVSIEFNLLCLTIGIWLFIAVLCGRRAAKKRDWERKLVRTADVSLASPVSFPLQ
jgi:hypothetical protein